MRICLRGGLCYGIQHRLYRWQGLVGSNPVFEGRASPAFRTVQREELVLFVPRVCSSPYCGARCRSVDVAYGMRFRGEVSDDQANVAEYKIRSLLQVGSAD